MPVQLHLLALAVGPTSSPCGSPASLQLFLSFLDDLDRENSELEQAQKSAELTAVVAVAVATNDEKEQLGAGFSL